MARAKCGKARKVAKVHDRGARGLLRDAEVTTIDTDDSLGLDACDRIVTLRAIRNDPLGRLHSRRQIDEAQYQGGRAFQDDWEKAERGPQAVDPAKPFKQGDASRRAKARKVIQQGFAYLLGPKVRIIGVREAVRLVPESLKEPQARMVKRDI